MATRDSHIALVKSQIRNLIQLANERVEGFTPPISDTELDAETDLLFLERVHRAVHEVLYAPPPKR